MKKFLMNVQFLNENLNLDLIILIASFIII